MGHRKLEQKQFTIKKEPKLETQNLNSITPNHATRNPHHDNEEEKT
jgi:hypothetical protein